MAEKKSDYWVLWKELGKEINRRIGKPFGQPSFVLYFVGVIVIVGGLGVWISIYRKNWGVVPRDLSNYSLAILSVAVADLIIFESSKRSLQMVAFVALLLGIGLAVLGQTNFTLTWTYVCSICGALLGLSLWWVANADNIKLAETDSAPKFGDPEEFGGDLTGIKS